MAAPAPKVVVLAPGTVAEAARGYVPKTDPRTLQEVPAYMGDCTLERARQADVVIVCEGGHELLAHSDVLRRHCGAFASMSAGPL